MRDRAGVPQPRRGSAPIVRIGAPISRGVGRRARRIVGAASTILLLAALVQVPSATAGASFSTHLTRAPYLSDLVGLHVNVNWATDRSATSGSLRWGAVTGGVCTLTATQVAARTSITVGSVSEYQWKAPLTLSAPGTYCYRPLLAGTDLLGTSGSPQFQTQVQPGDPTPFSFAVFGDWGLVDSSGNNPDQANLMAQVAASGARFAVTVGDNGYPSGSQTNYGDLQQRGSNTSAIFGPPFWAVASSSTPIFTAPGNHGLSGTAHTDITTWTQDTAVASSGGRYQNDLYCCVNGSNPSNYGSEWYAFDAGPARFYILDSAWGDTNPGSASPYANDAAAHFAPGTPEYQWLLNDLQTHPTAVKFAFSHYPWYSDSPTQGSDPFLQGPSKLEGLLGQYGVDIVFNGHAHYYERNNRSAPGMPITYVTGGGGATLQPIGPCHPYDAYGIGWSPSKLEGTACGAASAPTAASRVFHFLKVTVSGTRVTVAPTDETGQTFDVQTYDFSSGDDFSMSASPSSVTVTAGQGTTSSIGTAVTSGSPQSVALSASGLPAGASASFNPVTITSGQSSTMTIGTSASTPPGTYPITVTGTGTSATHTTTVSLTVTGGTSGGPALVQSTGATEAAPSTALTATFAAPTAPGNLLVLSASEYTGATNHITSVTDSAGNAWTRIGAFSVSGHNSNGELWYAPNAASATSVTVHTASATTLALSVQEFSGVAATNPLDGSAGTANTGTSASSGSFTPTGANELLVGFVAGHANAQAMTVTAGGYTVQPQQTSTGNIASVVTGYQVLGSPSAQSFTATFGSSMYWAAGIAAFRPA